MVRLKVGARIGLRVQDPGFGLGFSLGLGLGFRVQGLAKGWVYGRV